MKLPAFLLACLLSRVLVAQDPILVSHGCSYDGEETGKEFYQFEPSDEADRIVLEICNAVSLAKNFTLKASNVKNALATTEGNQRYILYSTSFMEKFKSEARTRWAAYSVLAHEIGHHLNGHNFAEKDPSKRKRMELEADKFSGGVLRLLNASLDQAQAGIETFGLEGESRTHPPASARREAIASGWKKQDELRGSNADVGKQPSVQPPKEDPVKKEPAVIPPTKTQEPPKFINPTPVNNVAITPGMLVGTWGADVMEFNVPQTILLEFTEDYSVQGVNGTMTFVFLVNNNISSTGVSYYLVENNTLYEYNAFLTMTAYGTLRYINNDTFEVTIVNNGVPAYSGLKRVYQRIRL
jgi:hypothetical protein